MIDKVALILIVAVLCICPVVNSKAVEEIKAVEEKKEVDEIRTCIDIRSDCLAIATATYCQNQYDYRGGLAYPYDYTGIAGLRGQCCRTCTERYWGGGLGHLGPLPLIPNGYLGPSPLIPNGHLGHLGPLAPNACIDTRPNCLVIATATYCQNRYDYRGGLANPYDYTGYAGLHGHCCRTCTERYGRGYGHYGYGGY